MNNATKLAQDFEKLLSQSTTVLLTCHTGADIDALSSVIATKKLLEQNYPNLDITAVSERIPASLSFIPSYKEVKNGSILQTLEKQQFDLVIVLDFSQWHLASKTDATAIQELVTKAGIPFVVIDHHPEEYKNLESDIYINLDSTSTCTSLFILFSQLLQKPILPEVAQVLLYGIVADTNRFKYKYNAASQATIFRIVADLLEKSPESIEDIARQMDRFDSEVLKIVSLFINNITLFNKTFAYTTITEQELLETGVNTKKLSDAALFLANEVIATVDTASHGVVVYPHLQEKNTYTARFRSTSPDFPVQHIAAKLGGGGHPQSAAARLNVPTVEDAVKKILALVENKKS